MLSCPAWCRGQRDWPSREVVGASRVHDRGRRHRHTGRSWSRRCCLHRPTSTSPSSGCRHRSEAEHRIAAGAGRNRRRRPGPAEAPTAARWPAKVGIRQQSGPRSGATESASSPRPRIRRSQAKCQPHHGHSSRHTRGCGYGEPSTMICFDHDLTVTIRPNVGRLCRHCC